MGERRLEPETACVTRQARRPLSPRGRTAGLARPAGSLPVTASHRGIRPTPFPTQASANGIQPPEPEGGAQVTTVHHRYATVQARRLFYREAGPRAAPDVVLLHGFPTSSFMFRDLIPLLADAIT
jgi:hypothetical protein